MATCKVAFEFADRATLPLTGLLQQRQFLSWTERGGLPAQRSDGAISSYVFQDSFPTHQMCPSAGSGRMWHRTIFKSLAGLAEMADGLQTVELRTMVKAARRLSRYGWRF